MTFESLSSSRHSNYETLELQLAATCGLLVTSGYFIWELLLLLLFELRVLGYEIGDRV